MPIELGSFHLLLDFRFLSVIDLQMHPNLFGYMLLLIFLIISGVSLYLVTKVDGMQRLQTNDFCKEIVTVTEKLFPSCTWDKNTFTIDESCTGQTYEANLDELVRLWKKGED